jgi:hypothetical protein
MPEQNRELKNRVREIRSHGSVRGQGRNGLALLGEGQDGVLGFAGFRQDSTCVARATPAEQVAPRLAAGVLIVLPELLIRLRGEP